MDTTNFATYILKKMLDCNEERVGTICVPIEKINNVPCCMQIRCSNTFMNLVISSEREYYDSDGNLGDETLYNKFHSFKDAEINIESIKNIIDTWFMEIDDLVFCKINSEFKNKNHVGMFDFLKTIKNISLGIECCVCLELTRNTTCCKHYLCMVCLFSIKPNSEEHIICPICREILA